MDPSLVNNVAVFVAALWWFKVDNISTTRLACKFLLHLMVLCPPC